VAAGTVSTSIGSVSVETGGGGDGAMRSGLDGSSISPSDNRHCCYSTTTAVAATITNPSPLLTIDFV